MQRGNCGPGSPQAFIGGNGDESVFRQIERERATHEHLQRMRGGCRWLAEAGCTANEIISISGQKNLKEVTRCTDAARRSALACSAKNTV